MPATLVPSKPAKTPCNRFAPSSATKFPLDTGIDVQEMFSRVRPEPWSTRLENSTLISGSGASCTLMETSPLTWLPRQRESLMSSACNTPFQRATLSVGLVRNPKPPAIRVVASTPSGKGWAPCPKSNSIMLVRAEYPAWPSWPARPSTVMLSAAGSRSPSPRPTRKVMESWPWSPLPPPTTPRALKLSSPMAIALGDASPNGTGTSVRDESSSVDPPTMGSCNAGGPPKTTPRSRVAAGSEPAGGAVSPTSTTVSASGCSRWAPNAPISPSL